MTETNLKHFLFLPFSFFSSRRIQKWVGPYPFCVQRRSRALSFCTLLLWLIYFRELSNGVCDHFREKLEVGRRLQVPGLVRRPPVVAALGISVAVGWVYRRGVDWRCGVVVHVPGAVVVVVSFVFLDVTWGPTQTWVTIQGVAATHWVPVMLQLTGNMWAMFLG